MVDLNGFGITGITATLLTFFVVGFVEMVKAAFDRDWRRFTIILIAGIAGGLVSPLLGLNLITGVCGGFAASGAITLVQNVGKR